MHFISLVVAIPMAPMGPMGQGMGMGMAPLYGPAQAVEYQRRRRQRYKLLTIVGSALLGAMTLGSIGSLVAKT